ncbi:RteC domain-containing protein [Mucilaginibacter sp. L3T2-6]|uniref:RteC domain-containing protein n=1 Tax=Mucilaginibacter sp. L3T2-6 TaxID=3062491 RepID=UPI002675923F|nr:RteC domain-containing protein [Mucilaginibacter sp. L3T2-6]MDO3641262.1 RteC domain-containing protein [Mucilaginibacter sp. L3T2-6]
MGSAKFKLLPKFSFLYQYFQLDSTDMDAVFFVRGAHPKDVLVPDVPDLDPEFSTACDHAWARFMANDRLQEWILAEMRGLEGGGLLKYCCRVRR